MKKNVLLFCAVAFTTTAFMRPPQGPSHAYLQTTDEPNHVETFSGGGLKGIRHLKAQQAAASTAGRAKLTKPLKRSPLSAAVVMKEPEPSPDIPLSPANTESPAWRSMSASPRSPNFYDRHAKPRTAAIPVKTWQTPPKAPRRRTRTLPHVKRYAHRNFSEGSKPLSQRRQRPGYW